MILHENRFSFELHGSVVFGAIRFVWSDDPPPSRVVNRDGMAPWVMSISERVVPRGIIKIYQAGAVGLQQPLATLQSSGESFQIEGGQSIDMVVVPSAQGIALTLGFMKAEGESTTQFLINIKQKMGAQGKVREPSFGIYTLCKAVAFDLGAYQAADRGMTFIQVGGQG